MTIGIAEVLPFAVGAAFPAGDAASESTTTDTVSWSQVLFEAGIDAFSPVKALTLALLLVGVNLVSKGIPPLT